MESVVYKKGGKNMKICISHVNACEMPILQYRLTSAFGVQDFEVIGDLENVWLKLK
jgi:hypothetical protein